MANSAKPALPMNNGQTDQDRGTTGKLPVGTNMAPRGREQTVKGPVSLSPKQEGAEALVRKVPGRGQALNGLSNG